MAGPALNVWSTYMRSSASHGTIGMPALLSLPPLLKYKRRQKSPSALKCPCLCFKKAARSRACRYASNSQVGCSMTANDTTCLNSVAALHGCRGSVPFNASLANMVESPDKLMQYLALRVSSLCFWWLMHCMPTHITTLQRRAGGQHRSF